MDSSAVGSNNYVTMLYPSFTIIIYCTIALHSIQGSRQAFPQKFWQSAAPGELLETLDLMTSDAVPIYAALSAPNPANRKAEAPKKSASINSTASDSEESSSFDQAYEQFVRNYFNKRSRPTSIDETSALSAEALSLEAGNSASIETERKSSPQGQCKKIRKNKQDCVICRNPSNNEKSETCAYSTETKPLQYAYEEQKNYKTSRKSPNGKDNSETEEVSGSEESAEPSEELQTTSKSTPLDRNLSNKPTEASTCVKITHRHKICYHCENIKRGKFTKCYAKYEGQANSNSKIKGKGHQIQQHKQRIHKRTISYSYFNKTGN